MSVDGGGSSGGALRAVRRGLPRVAGGAPWPPATEVVDPWAAEVANMTASVPAEPVVAATSTDTTASAPDAAPTLTVASSTTLRQGLPRVAGGAPWPPARTATSAEMTPGAETPPTITAPNVISADRAADADADAGADAAVLVGGGAARGAPVALRRGLPRTVGAEPWPPAGEAVDRWARVEASPAPEPIPEPIPEPVLEQAVDTAAPDRILSPTAAAAAAMTAAAAAKPAAAPPRELFGLRIRTVVLGAIGLVVVAVVAVLAAQWFRAQPFGQDFITTYPGETHLPDGAPVGFPAWLGWQHFFNVFLMVLIIRSGLQVRREKRPTAFWTPKWNAKRKISLALWFHQSLDILWLLNGVVFVVLLLISGQWMRVVPTDWAVFPNAVSAAIQYLSLHWPTENGWVNYNSLQVLAYFTTIFIAAPLAAITGVRMSGIWPKKAVRLSRAYPMELARAVHFPVMLYFCAFIVVHVALVFSTGILRNLNHMYGGQDAVNWWGFGVFVVSMLVIVGGWIAARPIVLAPIAGLFGTVKGR